MESVRQVPFSEADVTERPASLYAATKKADELMAHTYNYIYGISVTGLRYFTVYGPWGRPDMAAFSFSRAITMGKPVRIFQGPNGVELSRDFTFIDDIVLGTVAALDTAQPSAKPAPPPRVYNLGNTHPVNVTTFVAILEQHLGATALRECAPARSPLPPLRVGAFGTPSREEHAFESCRARGMRAGTWRCRGRATCSSRTRT